MCLHNLHVYPLEAAQLTRVWLIDSKEVWHVEVIDNCWMSSRECFCDQLRTHMLPQRSKRFKSSPRRQFVVGTATVCFLINIVNLIICNLVIYLSKWKTLHKKPLFGCSGTSLIAKDKHRWGLLHSEVAFLSMSVLCFIMFHVRIGNVSSYLCHDHCLQAFPTWKSSAKLK